MSHGASAKRQHNYNVPVRSRSLVVIPYNYNGSAAATVRTGYVDCVHPLCERRMILTSDSIGYLVARITYVQLLLNVDHDNKILPLPIRKRMSLQCFHGNSMKASVMNLWVTHGPVVRVPWEFHGASKLQ